MGGGLSIRRLGYAEAPAGLVSSLVRNVGGEFHLWVRQLPIPELQNQRDKVRAFHMGDFRNYGPYLDPYYNTAPLIFRVPKKGP